MQCVQSAGVGWPDDMRYQAARAHERLREPGAIVNTLDRPVGQIHREGNARRSCSQRIRRELIYDVRERRESQRSVQLTRSRVR